MFWVENEPVDFNGRVFEIIEVLDSLSVYGKKNKGKDLHVVSRNFPIQAEEIKKKYNWNERGDAFLFCYTDPKGAKWTLLTRRVENKITEGFRKEF